MQRHRLHPIGRNAVTLLAALAGLVAASGSAQAQTTPLVISVDAATGTLNVGNGAPGNKNVKVEMKQGIGVAVVIDQAAPAPQTFTGIRRINMNTGAGSDQIEFDIDVGQALALNVNSGSGDANVKVQWKLRPGTGGMATSLIQTSGGGSVNTELDFESEADTSSFDWSTNFGGGNKLIKGAVEFKPGARVATSNIGFALGGGTHLVAFEGDNAASDARFNFNAGNASEVLYKMSSTNPTQRLDVNTTVRGQKNGIEILSAAPDTRVALNGGTANLGGETETNWSVVQTVPGTINASTNFVASVVATKFGAKFEGPQSTLNLNGSVTGSPGNDGFKIETSAATVNSGLLLDALGGDNVVDFIAVGRLLATPTPLRLRMGAGNDNVNLLAGAGSTANPAIDCGAGNDNAKASVGTPTGCENFSR